LDALVETLSGGQWTASEAPLPADASRGTSSESGRLVSIDCTTTTACTAVGDYNNDNASPQDVGLIDTLSGTTWSALTAPVPGGVNLSSGISASSVSCLAAAECVAVGASNESSLPIAYLMQQSSDGTWSAEGNVLPPDAQIGPNAHSEFNSTSCAAGICEAVGDYRNMSLHDVAMIDRFSGNAWTSQSAPVPGDAGAGANQLSQLAGVSCTFDGCTAVGHYETTAGPDSAPLIESITPGGAPTSTPGQLPGDTKSPPTAGLNAVSCLSAEECVAVGSYVSKDAGAALADTPLIDSSTGGNWTNVPAPLPAGAPPVTNAVANASLRAVSCSSRGGCEAAGDYNDMAGNRQVTLDAYTPPEGYWSVASDGGIFTYGNAIFHGSMGGQHLNAPMVGMAETPGPGGYWEVGADGGIFSFGNAIFHGSTGGLRLNKPVLGMAATPDGGGYWFVASDGGVFNYGDAGFYGSAGSIHLNAPVVGMAATPDGQGYWLVASDGGIFSYGNAGFLGSRGGQPLNKPIVGMAATPDGGGYWLVASDGGIFAYGDAAFFGSRGGQPLNKPIVGMAATPDGLGYWLVASDGGIFTYGDAGFFGSAGSIRLNKPIVGIMTTFDGAGYWLVASDGGIFTYGDAGFEGSAGNLHLNAPVVGGTPT
jgi:hypothetical protein